MRSRATILAVAAAGALVVCGGAAARAEPPAATGWWTSANPGLVPGAPPPNAGDVPDGGLLVEGGSASRPGADNGVPTTYSAALYQLPAGGVAQTLVLSVAPNAASTPNTTLQLCPLQTPFVDPADGGPIGDAPPFDCSAHVTAGPSDDGGQYAFDLAGLSFAGAAAVAVLPTAVTDRVVLAAPGPDSLMVALAAPPTTSAAPPPTSPPTAPPSTTSNVPAPQTVPPTFAAPTPSIAPAPPSTAAPAAPAPAQLTAGDFALPDEGGISPANRAVALALAAGLALGGGAWRQAGKTARENATRGVAS